METRNIFKTLSDGRFPSDRIDDPLPQPIRKLVERAKRIAMTREQKREKQREYKQRYKVEHADKYMEQKRAEGHNRRAKIKKAGGKLSRKECQSVFDKYGKRCLRCGSEEHITLDHVIPLALGGANTVDNIQPLCMMCNSTKGVATIDYR